MDKKKLLEHESFEHMEESLYNPANPETKFRRGILHKETLNVPHEWTHNQEEMESEVPRIKKSSFLKKFFLSSLLFFLVALGFGVYEFFLKGKINPEENIEVTILGSTFSEAGEGLPLTVDIVNKNNFPLELVDLIVESPKNGKSPTASLEDTERTRVSIGTIPSGERHIQEMPVTLYGAEGDVREIFFTLEYHIPNSSAIFQKQKTYSVVLSSSPVTAVINAPDVAVPNQEYVFNIELTTNTKKPLENIMVALEYPVGFEYKSSSLEPISLNNVWDVGTLTPGITKTIEVTGVFLGQEGEEKSIRSLVGTYTSSERKKVSTNLGTLIHTVLLQKPFLSTTLAINGEQGNKVAILPGEQIQGQLSWKNNLKNKILDAEIQVRLKGDLLERERVEPTDGFYNSQIDAIVWNKNTISDFAQIPVGASGSFQFTIPTIKPNADGSVKNPNVEFEIFVKGFEDGASGTLKKIESTDTIVVRFIANTTIASSTLHSTGAFQNTGPVPPQVNKETTYTVLFTIKNTTNDITQGELRAKLPANVSFTGLVSPQGEKVMIDERTGELIWRIGDVSQSTQEVAKSVSIQLKATPSLPQVGNVLTLLSNVSFKATDRFTGKMIAQDLADSTSETARIEGEDPSYEAGKVVK